jgi:DNA-binding transcriptional MerR regulator
VKSMQTEYNSGLRLPGALLAAIGSLISLALLSQQTDAQAIRIAQYRPRFIVVFLDETGSRAQTWEAMREKAAFIASKLKNREAIAVIGIDDHGYDEDDIRIPLSIVQAPSDLMTAVLEKQRQAIIQQMNRLQRRRNPQRTDIVGAIRQALEMANKESAERRTVLAFFSDMQQTPQMPDAGAFKDIHFPAGTEAYCFYVNGSKHYTFDQTVDLWQHQLNAAGVTASAVNFHEKGTVDVGVSQAFR